MPPSNPRRYRLGFVGLGRVSDVHYAALRAHPERACLAAVCDIREKAVAARAQAWEVPGFSDLEAMLESMELDAVVVMLPHDAHCAIMRTLLDRSLPVLLEKPLARDEAEAEEIVERAEAAGVPVLIGHNGLFHPSYQQLLQMLREGAIGDPLFASARSLQWLHFKEWDFRLSAAKTGGGAWIDCAGHLLYRLEPVFGEIASLRGERSTRARPEMQGEDTALAVIRYRNGGIAQVAVSYGCKLPGYERDWPGGCEQKLIFHGTQGTLEYEICPHPCLRLFADAGNPSIEVGVESSEAWRHFPVGAPFDASFAVQMGHFLDCLDGSDKPRVPPRAAASLLGDLKRFYRG